MDRRAQAQAGAAAGFESGQQVQGRGLAGEERSRNPLLVGGHEGGAGAGDLAGLAAVFLVQPRRL